jgi:glutathione S-transferase
MQIFVKTGCPFCARALAVLDAYGLSYEEKNVADPEVVKELIALGGKKQEPFLVDGEMMLYESKSIVKYIEKKYGNPEILMQKPRLYFARGNEVCPT